MTHAEQLDAASPEARGEVRFIDAQSRVRLRSAIEAAGWTLVAIDAPESDMRGLLDELIYEQVERALAHRGAGRPGIAPSRGVEEVLRDQVTRGRSVGVRGIALALASLSGLGGPGATLDPQDSATLRLLSTACKSLPIALWLDPADELLGAHGPPIALGELVRPIATDRSSVADSVPDSNGSSEMQHELLDSGVSAESPAEGADGAVDGDEMSEASPLRWRIFRRELDEAQGPKPLAVVERLFVERYVPLAEAVARAEAEAQAQLSLSRFSKSFEKSYREAYAATKITRRRPTMVLDAPQVAARIARLHGARQVMLALVDAMRFDVGVRVRRLMHDALYPEALLAEEMLLWSGLPTTTLVQLELMARGPQGLQEVGEETDDESEMVASRGKAAASLRRLKVGGREIYKLDVIQAALAESGPEELERLEQLALSAAEPLIKFARGLQPRTLLFVFGDHGFELPALPHGTGPARQGGASPEQVLVPGHAWLIGGMH